MEEIPAFEVFEVLGAVDRLDDGGERAVDGLSGEVGARSVRSEEVTGQVEQLASHLRGGQTEKIAHRAGTYLLQGSQQTHQGVLEDVVGLDPVLDTGKATDHLAGEALQTSAEVTEQVLARGGIAGAHAVQPVVQLEGVDRRFGHVRPRWSERASPPRSPGEMISSLYALPRPEKFPPRPGRFGSAGRPT